MAAALGLWEYSKYESLPHQPCSSTVENGKFIDENLQSYTFNGVITWWPDNNRLTLFGVKEENGNKRVLERTLVMDVIDTGRNNIHAKVKEVSFSVADQMPKEQALIGEKGKEMSLIFKRINSKRWLMLINDNWVMMCENK
jgi:hypothetical protein